MKKPEGRRETDEQRCQRRRRQSKPEYAAVDAGLLYPRNGGTKARHRQANEQHRHGHAGGAADERERQALGHHLADNA